ncbi:hypothetical protein Tco_1355812 [Tanacetum coccineum]
MSRYLVARFVLGYDHEREVVESRRASLTCRAFTTAFDPSFSLLSHSSDSTFSPLPLPLSHSRNVSVACSRIGGVGGAGGRGVVGSRFRGFVSRGGRGEGCLGVVDSLPLDVVEISLE